MLRHFTLIAQQKAAKSAAKARNTTIQNFGADEN